MRRLQKVGLSAAMVTASTVGACKCSASTYADLAEVEQAIHVDILEEIRQHLQLVVRLGTSGPEIQALEVFSVGCMPGCWLV